MEIISPQYAAQIEAANTFYFLGVDSAPAQGKRSDDGALSVLRVRPRAGITEPTNSLMDWVGDYVWAYRLRGADVRQWSGFIHKKHRQFGLAGICMDSQGGGQWIELELIKEKQIIDGVEIAVMAIASLDGIERNPNAQMILTMYRRRDPGIQQLWPHLAGDDNLYEAMHIVFQEAVAHRMVRFPKPMNQRAREETADWPEEKRWALQNIDAGRNQLTSIQVATLGDGSWAVTRNGAKQFSAGGKKDIAYSMIYAYVRFMIWLTLDEREFGSGSQGAGATSGYRVF